MLNLTPEGDLTLNLSEVEGFTIETNQVVRLLTPFNLISKAINCYLNLFTEVEIKNLQVSANTNILSIYSSCLETTDENGKTVLTVEGGQCIPLIPATWNEITFIDGTKKSSAEFKTWFQTECPLCVRNVSPATKAYSIAIKMDLIFKGLQQGIGIPYQRQTDFQELALLQRANIMKAFNQAREKEKEMDDTDYFINKGKRKNIGKKKI